MRRASLLAILGALLCLPKSLSSEYGDSDRGAVLYRAKRDVGYCGGTFTDIAGEFSSPQYPSNYNGNQECYYYITVPDGFYIVLQFSTFVLESSTTGDYVEIYNSHQTSSQNRIGIYYETDSPGVVQSSGSELLVTFNSDYSVSAQGFLAKYMVATRDYSSGTGTCGGTYSNFESGAFTSPFFPIGYLPSLDCYYSISMPTAGSKIEVEILYILTEALYDYVEVHDGNSADATSLGKFSGSSLPSPVTSSGPELFVHFHSDRSNSERGFYAIYRLASTITYSVCSDTLVEGFGGIIRSHNSYPDYYPRNLDCLLMLPIRGVYDRIYLKFTEIDLYSSISDDCSGSDVITVTDSTGAVDETLCQNDDVRSIDIPADVISLNITFDSSGIQTTAYKGFQATFSLYYQPLLVCSGDDFSCTNGRCISIALRCDGFDHCEDNSDEEDCPSTGLSSLDVEVIAGIAGGSFAFLVLAATCAYCCCKKKTSTAPSTSMKPVDTGMRTIATTGIATGPVDPTKDFVFYETAARGEVQKQPFGGQSGHDGPGYGYYDPGFPDDGPPPPPAPVD